MAANENRHITLANYPYRPQERLALSLGPNQVGAMVGVVPRENTGRINRAFDQVTNDGLIYCYTDAEVDYRQHPQRSSWFLSLESPTALGLEMVAQSESSEGGNPCDADPSSWAFGPNAMKFVR